MNRQKKFYLLISSLFIATTIFVLSIIVGSYLYLSNLNANFLEQKYYTEMLTEKEQILAELQERYDKIKTNVDVINSSLPEEKDVSRLISDISAISERSKLKFVSVKSDATNPKKGAANPSLLQTESGKFGPEMPLTISVKGSYNNFVSFQRSLENYQRLLNVTAIEIKRDDSEEGGDTIEATIKLVVYME